MPRRGYKGCENFCFYSNFTLVLRPPLSIILSSSHLSSLAPLERGWARVERKRATEGEAAQIFAICAAYHGRGRGRITPPGYTVTGYMLQRNRLNSQKMPRTRTRSYIVHVLDPALLCSATIYCLFGGHVRAKEKMSGRKRRREAKMLIICP